MSILVKKHFQLNVFLFAVFTLVSFMLSAQQSGLIDHSFNIDIHHKYDHTSVSTVVEQSQGRLIITGIWDTIDGIPGKHIARVFADGKLDTTFKVHLNTYPNAESFYCKAFPLLDSKFMLVGIFDSINDVRRREIAVMNEDGSVDLNFNAGEGFNGQLVGVKEYNGKYYCWSSDSFNGKACGVIVRLNKNGNLDSTFNCPIVHDGTNFFGSVHAEILSDGKIILGFQNDSVAKVYKLNQDGSLDTSFNPPILNTYYPDDVKVQKDGKILIAGIFYEVNGKSRKCMARLNADGTLDPSFNTGDLLNYQVKCIDEMEDGKILVTGRFGSYYGPSTVEGIVRLNIDGSVDSTFYLGSGLEGSYSASEGHTMLRNGQIVVFGYFRKCQGEDRVGIVRLNGDNYSQAMKYHPMVLNGSYWKDSQWLVDQNEKIYTDAIHWVEGDTTIDGIGYKKLRVQRSKYPESHSYFTIEPAEYEGGIREDEFAKKIWFRANDSGSEILLYDFNIRVSDTLSAVPRLNQNVVLRIDSVMVGDAFHKRFLMSYEAVYSEDSSYALIEGVGSTKGLLSQMKPDSESGSILKCFSSSNSSYHTLDSDCKFSVDVSERSSSVQTALAFPNPFKQTTVVMVGPEFECLVVTNSLGQRVPIDYSYDGKNCLIAKGSTPPGVYFLTLFRKASTIKGSIIITE